MHMLKYGQETKKTKAEFIEVGYLTEAQFRSNQFSKMSELKVTDLAD